MVIFDQVFSSKYSSIHFIIDFAFSNSIPTCNVTNKNVPNSPNERSLVFIVQTTSTMNEDLQALEYEMGYLAEQIALQQHWFANYTLVLYDYYGKFL